MRKALMKKRSLVKAKQHFIDEVKQLESSKYAQTLVPAMKLGEHATTPENFIVDPIYTSHPMKQQLAEVRGKVLKDEAYEYHTVLYKQLLETVVPLRHKYRFVKDIESQKQIAKVEYDAWDNYLEQRKAHIADLPR